MLLFLQKHIKTPDRNEAIRSCSTHEFFTFDYINTCGNIQSFGTQLTINHFLISKLRYKNLYSFFQLLLLLAGDISLNPCLIHQAIEWNVFQNRGIHFIDRSINSLLSKIEELRFSAKSTNAAVIGNYESKLHASVLAQEISTDNYKILR